jgi:dCMP deaminase
MKWHKRFLDLAAHVASWSRDPSTRVGAVVVRPDRTVSSMGYNGFPRGVIDSDERYADRPTKYQFTCHAEANAIVSVSESLVGHTLYATLFPCNECAKLIIQSGIKTVVAPAEGNKRWTEAHQIASQMFDEAKIEVITIDKT